MANLTQLPNDILIRIYNFLDEESLHQLISASRVFLKISRDDDALIWKPRVSRWYPLASLLELGDFQNYTWQVDICHPQQPLTSEDHDIQNLSESSGFEFHPIPSDSSITSWHNLVKRLLIASKHLPVLLDAYADQNFNSLPVEQANPLARHQDLDHNIEKILLDSRFFRDIETELLTLSITRPYARLTHAYVADKILRMKLQQQCLQCWDEVNKWDEYGALLISFWLRRFDYSRLEEIKDLARAEFPHFPIATRVVLATLALDASGIDKQTLENIIKYAKYIISPQLEGYACSKRESLDNTALGYGNSSPRTFTPNSIAQLPSLSESETKCVQELKQVFRAAATNDWVALANFAGKAVAACIERMVSALKQRLSSAALQAMPQDFIKIMNQVFFEESGFAAAQLNAERYYDPANSHLDLVVKNKQGIPITLSCLYAAVCRECGLRLDALQVPNRYHLRFVDYPDLYLDVFEGGIIRSPDNLESLVQSFNEYNQVCRASDWIDNSDGKMTLSRILNNLFSLHSHLTQRPGFGVDLGSLKRSTGILEGIAFQRYAITKNDSDIQICFSFYVNKKDPEIADYLFRFMMKHCSVISSIMMDRNVKTVNALKLGTFFGGTEIKTRDKSNVEYRVGQCVQHARHSYKAVVVGWDYKCEKGEIWSQGMDIDSTQPFYYVLVDNHFRGPDSFAYVAQEHLTLLNYGWIDNALVNRHFKAYDPVACTYIPNDVLAALYPDDFNGKTELFN